MTTLKIANQDGFRWGEAAYLIGHEYGTMCVSYGNSEQDALDHAVDAGFLDVQLMAPEDHAEYLANGWDDSYSYLGNACEPYWTQGLWMKPASERKEFNNGVV